MTAPAVMVTGAARGIGRAVAVRFCRDGWHVVANDVDASSLRQTVDDLPGEAMAVPGDASDPESAGTLLAAVANQWGRLDALVNNAAITGPRGGLDAWGPARFRDFVAANAAGPYGCTHAAVPLLRGQPAPAVVNLSSVGASRAFRGHPAYVASKGAIEAQTRALALDLAGEGIRVNAVAPGMVATEPWGDLPAAERDRRSQLVPLGRPATPEDVADAVAFLVSRRAAYITGQVLGVDGGLSAQAYSPSDEEPLWP